MRLGVAVDLDSRDGTLAKGALITNGFVETEGAKAFVFKRSGLTLVSDIGSSVGQGITSYKDSTGLERLYAVQDGALVLGDVPGGSGAWTEQAVSFNGGSGERHAFASWRSKVWAVGGKSVYSKTTYNGTTWTTEATDVWVAVDASFRWQGKLLVFNDALYLIAPRLDGVANGTKEVWRSLNGTSWTRLTAAAAFPTTYGAQVQVLGGKMFYLGSTAGTGSPTDDVYSSSDGITWTLLTSAPEHSNPTIRSEFGSCSFGGRLWVVGGRIGGAAVDSVYYSTDGISWTQATASAAFVARSYPIVISAGGQMIYAMRDTDAGVDDLYTSLDGVTWTSVSHSGWSTNFGRASGNSPESNQGVLFDNKLIIYGGGGIKEIVPDTTTTGSATVLTVGSADMFDFAQDYNGKQIMVRGATTAYRLTTADNDTDPITDTDYPTETVRGCIYLGGRFHVMDPDGTIWSSAEDDCTDWPDTDFVSAEFEPDGGIALAKYGSYAVAFGNYTTEMFYLTTDVVVGAGSPLAPVQSGVFLIGCAHANSLAQIESTLIWIGQRKGSGTTFQKGRFIAMLEGTSYKIVSTPSVSRVLDEDDLAVVNSCVMSLFGHVFYILTLGTSAITLVYDLNTKMWFRWTRGTVGSAQSVTSITQSAGVATVTLTAHGYSDGDEITIAGANQAGYNLTRNVTKTGANTFTYPVDSGTVTPATGTITATGYTQGTFNMVASCNYNGKQVFQESSGGGIFEMNEDAQDDNGSYIDWHVRLQSWDGGNNLRKFMSELQVIGDKVNITGLVRYSDDDYTTFSTYRRITLNLNRPLIARMGSFFRRALEFRQTLDVAKIRVEKFEVIGEGIEEEQSA